MGGEDVQGEPIPEVFRGQSDPEAPLDIECHADQREGVAPDVEVVVVLGNGTGDAVREPDPAEILDDSVTRRERIVLVLRRGRRQVEKGLAVEFSRRGQWKALDPV